MNERKKFIGLHVLLLINQDPETSVGEPVPFISQAPSKKGLPAPALDPAPSKKTRWEPFFFVCFYLIGSGSLQIGLPDPAPAPYTF